MKKESIQALVERYNQIKAEKKEDKRLLALLKKKELHRDEVMQGRSDRSKEHRKIVMYELHKKRQKRKMIVQMIAILVRCSHKCLTAEAMMRAKMK